MKNVTSRVRSLAIDLAKNVFQLHGTDAKGKIVMKSKINRASLLEFVANLEPCNIYLEACGTANYWGRKFKEHGHRVKLINPKYVKPYVKRNKNDANDAAGIAAAARDPDMRFCEVKSEAQQDMQSIHRIRSLLVQQRTALANQIRGLLAEYGFAIPQGIRHLSKELPKVLEQNPTNLGSLVFNCLLDLYEHFCALSKRVTYYDNKIKGLSKSNEACQRLETIPGIGPMTATILASTLGNGGGFKNGRHFAAFLGLTPKQHSSGGKERMLGISKGGDTYTRTLLIHGARNVLRWVDKKAGSRPNHINCWLKRLLERRGYNKTAVALANKTARIAWAIIKEGGSYNINYKPSFIKAA